MNQNQKSKTLIGSLAIELTRRCNLNCIFCCKGEPQNIDISKEIIDKTISEMKNIYIHQLRLSGGEPFLASNEITYLINQIIDKKIEIGSVCIFTNGTIRNSQIKSDLNRLAVYLREIESDLKCYQNYCNLFWSKDLYAFDESKKINIIVSTERHDNQKDINKTINYYTSSNIEVLNQNESFVGNLKGISIEGNALKNHAKILTNPIKFDEVRVINNRYNYISNFSINRENEFNGYNNCSLIQKTISISANGNVYGGISLSYKNIDTEPMFNITTCNGDFVNKLIQVCWLHPITAEAARIREQHITYEWCKNNNYNVIVPGADKYNQESEKVLAFELKTLSTIVDRHEEETIKVHEKYQYLTLSEADMMALANICIETICCAFMPSSKKIGIDGLAKYLIMTDTPNGFIENLTIDNMVKIINFLEKENDLRKHQFDEDNKC